MSVLVDRIISGGQTGVDQGALDFALEKGMNCGGWCPRGRICETGRIPGKYPVREVDSGDYNERTLRNVLDADGTLIIIDGGLKEEGTSLTVSRCEKHGKPYRLVDLQDPGQLDVLKREFPEWIRQSGIRVLNVAGNRESNSPGIREATKKLLSLLIIQY